MEVFRLTDSAAPPRGTAWCIRTQHADGTVSYTLIREDGKAVNTPYRLIDSAVSGGSFLAYLQQDPAVCLYLRAVCAGFRLPCHDGQGTELPGRIVGGQFSKTLCTNWKWAEGFDFDIILYDDEQSLLEKKRLAAQSGVMFLIDGTEEKPSCNGRKAFDSEKAEGNQ